MYTARTGLILGFHGTDESIVKAVLNGESDLQAKTILTIGWETASTFGITAQAEQWSGRYN